MKKDCWSRKHKDGHYLASVEEAEEPQREVGVLSTLCAVERTGNTGWRQNLCCGGNQTNQDWRGLRSSSISLAKRFLQRLSHEEDRDNRQRSMRLNTADILKTKENGFSTRMAPFAVRGCM